MVRSMVKLRSPKTRRPFKKRYYRPDEVARALDVSIDTVYRRMADGSIRYIHVGKLHRIARAEYVRVIREGFPPKAPKRLPHPRTDRLEHS